ncbi:NfeD family protein [Proteocatella sphenisci]|uniref:NfeD family protein n=1 Tax=Proteocatella sphenisci TaxID=181070 RepID=UPI0004BABC3D|nr:NfeD family protein [Proteocatella sphenisci]
MNNLLLSIGIALIFAELFVPGGILGTVGVVTVVWALSLMTDTFLGLMLAITVSFIIIGIAIYILIKLIPKEKIKNTLILTSSLNRSEGYSTSKDLQFYIGKVGITESTLRPTGKAKIEGKIMDVVSEDKLIEKGKMVKVTYVDGTKVLVREIEGE